MKPFTGRLSSSVLLLASFQIPVAHSLFAQQDAVRSLIVTVTGDDKKPIHGAVIKVQNDSTKAILSYITDSSGSYTIKRLSGNTDYTVWAAWKGQRSKQKSLDHFNTAPEAAIDLTVDTH